MVHRLPPLQHRYEILDPESGEDYLSGVQNRCHYCENKFLLMFSESL